MITLYPLAASAGGRRIGILGGSFNPAHVGHLHISRLALTRLALDQVWWMVSPQNPLKAPSTSKPLAERMSSARRVAAADHRIVVTDIEVRLGTQYTADTMTVLKRSLPRTRLVWLMGADNLIQLPEWRDWTRLMKTVPVAVFPRPTYALRALAGKAAQRFRRFRLCPASSRDLADRTPPAWTYIEGPMLAASATAIRAARWRSFGN